MSPTGARRLAWALVSLAGALFVAGTALVLATSSGSLTGQDGFGFAFVVAFSTLGVSIAPRHRRNAIGWIFCGVAVAAGLGQLAYGYAGYGLSGGAGSRTLAEAAAVYAKSSWIGWIPVPVAFVLLLFPDGRLLSGRWRPVAWSAGLGIAGLLVLGILQPGRIEDFPQAVNPYGVEFPEPLWAIPVLLVVVALVGASLSLILRFRRVHGVVRQQIKWLAYAGAVGVPTVLTGIVFFESLPEAAADAMIQLPVLGLPLAAGIAITRYRLDDVDIVINRTLVYAALTGTLAATYLGGVLLLQMLLNPLTQRSDLAVAGSTLVVAALFRPARNRIQGLVDRRFFRRRYDAVRTLDAFNRRLREQLDIEALQRDLSVVVRDTVQPAQVSLWLRRSGS